MHYPVIDKSSNNDILTPEEVAQYLHKSLSWVYKNWKVLGGKKLRGSLFFPNKEELYEHLFHKRERMEVRLHPKRNQVYKCFVFNQGRGKIGFGKKKGVDKESKTEDKDPNRHKLLGAD